MRLPLTQSGTGRVVIFHVAKLVLKVIILTIHLHLSAGPRLLQRRPSLPNISRLQVGPASQLGTVFLVKGFGGASL